MSRTLNIAGRLHTIADDGVLISSDELLDERKNKKQNVVNADVDSALADRYTKSEVYTKQEVNNLVSPNQNYVTVAEFTDLPISGATDTIYRVSSWDGSLSTPAVDVTKYSEYAWDDTGYVFLCVKTQIGEVYDISAANSGAKYADLSAALGVDGGNVPSEIRRGGMSVKFVQSSDNKYVQYRLMSTSFSTNKADWQGVDDEPTAGSDNLVKSGGVANKLTELDNVVNGKEERVINITNADLGEGTIYKSDGTTTTTGRIVSGLIPVKSGDIFDYYLINAGIVYSVVAFDVNKHFIQNKSQMWESGFSGTYTVDSEVKYLQFQAQNNANNYARLTNGQSTKGLADTVSQHTDDIRQNKENIGQNTKDIDHNIANVDSVWSYIKEKYVGENELSNTEGGYHNTSGAYNTNTNRYRSSLLPCYEGMQIDYYLINTSTVPIIAAFDADKNFILDKSLIIKTESFWEKGTFIVPKGVFYVQIVSQAALNAYAKLNKMVVHESELADLQYKEGRKIYITTSDLVQTGADNAYYSSDGTPNYNTYRVQSDYISVEDGDLFEVALKNTTSVLSVVAFDKDKRIILSESVSGAKYGRYTVANGVCYLKFCGQSFYQNTAELLNGKSRKNVITRLNALETVKTRATKIIDFKDFGNNVNWKVSDDKISATCSTIANFIGANTSGGFYHKNYTTEDKFCINCNIIAEGDYFEIIIGKWASLAGTLFGIEYGKTFRNITVYKINENLNINRVFSFPIVGVNIEPNKKFSVSIKKYTNTQSLYSVSVTDLDGNVYTKEDIGYIESQEGSTSSEDFGNPVGYAWGKLCAFLKAGTRVTLSNLTFGYPVKDELKLIVVGSSYIEGNSIFNQKDKRFAAIVCNKIGWDNTICLGQGGLSALTLSERISEITDAFHNAKYILISIGNNDVCDNPSEEAIGCCTAHLDSIKYKIEDAGMIPVWIMTYGWAVNTIANMQGLWNWFLEQPYFIDTRNCFMSNGTVDATKFLPDRKHPTIATHEKVANCIIAQAGYLFD